jgi:hypothetical protein
LALGTELHTLLLIDDFERVLCNSIDAGIVARERLFLSNFTRCVFGIARSLLILFQGGIGLCLGSAFGIPFRILAQLFVDDGECLPGVLSRPLRLSLLGAHSVGVLSFRRADLSRCCRFSLCSLPLGRMWAGSRHRRK